MSDKNNIVRIAGDGPELVCEIVEDDSRNENKLTLLALHGNSSHRGIWRDVAYRLGGFRWILPDLRGHGDSGHVDPPAYNPEHQATDIVRIVQHFDLTHYALLGHSNGAISAARFFPLAAKTDAIPTPAAFVWIDIDPRVPDFQVEYFHQRARAVGRTFPNVDAVLLGMRQMYPATPLDRLRDFVDEGMQETDEGWRMKLDPATYSDWQPGDGRDDLPSITCPTLVLRGSESFVASPEGVVELEACLTDVEARETPGSHMLLIEHPETIAEMIGEFLARRVTD